MTDVEQASILVVDDESSIREVVALYLRRAGYQVWEAEDGARALDALEAESPDLIVLDLMLPEVDGLSILRWVRAHGKIPVIVLTARGEETDRILGLEMGADDYVVKPFSPRELVSRAKAVLRRTHATTDPTPEDRVLVFGDLRLDPATRLCHVRDEEVTLTAKEFDLLLELARHPRQVLNRDQLLERVWGLKDYIDPSSVTVHIHRLREKIEADPATPQHIQTVWGVGYKFEP